MIAVIVVLLSLNLDDLIITGVQFVVNLLVVDKCPVLHKVTSR